VPFFLSELGSNKIYCATMLHPTDADFSCLHHIPSYYGCVWWTDDVCVCVHFRDG